MSLSPFEPDTKETIDQVASSVSLANVTCLLHIDNIFVVLELYKMHL